MNQFTRREREILHNMIVRDAHAEKALFTKEEERTPYQNEILSLWDKLVEAVREA